jgi:amidase
VAAEVLARSALEQAAAVRSGEVSAQELVEASLAEIERLNGEVNAFVTLAAERALEEAAAIGPGDERPFAGVPIGIKDLGPATEGIRTTFGTAVTGDWVPTFDAEPVRRLRAAGAVVVGKTNTPEFGILPVTEPHRFGPTRNPHDLSRTSGGSSGGSAAAVAAGMVALASGSDGGGSIRIPASCCGLVGLKPSRGRVSIAPLPEPFAQVSVEGALARTVADSAAALDVQAGYGWGDVSPIPPPGAPFGEAPTREPPRLRVGVTARSPRDSDVDPACAAATAAAAELLESLGHEVTESEPEWRGEEFVVPFITIWSAQVAVSVERLASILGHPADESELEPLTQSMLGYARSYGSIEPLSALADLRTQARRIVTWWSAHDVFVTPTTAKPAIPIGGLEPEPGQPIEDMLRNAADFVPFTPPFNVTGQPAISLPLGQTEAGLPVGVQFVGPPAGEELLLSLAGQIERAAPWADRRPALATAA